MRSRRNEFKKCLLTVKEKNGGGSAILCALLSCVFKLHNETVSVRLLELYYYYYYIFYDVPIACWLYYYL